MGLNQNQEPSSRAEFYTPSLWLEVLKGAKVKIGGVERSKVRLPFVEDELKNNGWQRNRDGVVTSSKA